MRRGNAGDFQVHRTYAHAFSSKAYEQISRCTVPGEHMPGGEELDATLQPRISSDLPMRIGEAMDFSQPTAQLLFH